MGYHRFVTYTLPQEKQFAGSRVPAGWAHIGPAIGVDAVTARGELLKSIPQA